MVPTAASLLTDLPLLAFWPFASGWMLLWGLAAVVPILIHLWNRRAQQRMEWAAMQYLLAAVQKRARRIRLEQLLLLAIRTLLLLLFAVALAEPLLAPWSGLDDPYQTRGQTHHVLVVDSSYSMDFRQGETSRFERAQEWATQLVENSRQGDGFSLIAMGNPPRAVVSGVSFAANDLVDEIRSLPLEHGGADLAATLAEVEQMVQQARQQQPRLTQTRVYFLTDLGRNTWDDLEKNDVRRRIARLVERAQLRIIDLGESDGGNLAVTRLAVRQPLVTIGTPAAVEATIENFGSEPRQRHAVEFLVDGEPVHVEYLDVPAGGSASASFLHRFEVAGEHSMEVRLAADPLEVDNHRWLSVPVREAIEVLCVQGRAGEARYVALALNPVPSERPRVRTQIATESALLEQDLSQYDCIFLCNVGRFGQDEATVLHNYLAQGGGLVFLLGDQVQAESYNAQLGGELSGKRVLPARLGPLIAESQYTFHPGDYSHPIIAPFRGFERSGLVTTPIWRYFRLTPFPGGAARVVLPFHTGDPAIVEENLGGGRSIVYATAASPLSLDRSTNPPQPWSELATWPSFVPLIQETLNYALGGRSHDRNLIVGEPLTGTVPDDASGLSLDVVPPGDEADPIRIAIGAGENRWMLDGVRRSGLYQARYGPPLSTTRYYAVNVVPQESRLERFDPDLLPDEFQPNASEVEPQLGTLDPAGPSSLFRYALGGVLLLLISESCLAWYLGNRGA